MRRPCDPVVLGRLSTPDPSELRLLFISRRDRFAVGLRPMEFSSLTYGQGDKNASALLFSSNLSCCKMGLPRFTSVTIIFSAAQSNCLLLSSWLAFALACLANRTRYSTSEDALNRDILSLLRPTFLMAWNFSQLSCLLVTLTFRGMSHVGLFLSMSVAAVCCIGQHSGKQRS